MSFKKNFQMTMMRRLMPQLAANATLCLLSASAWAANTEANVDDQNDGPRWSLTASTGLDFSTGDYGGDEKTNTWYVPFGFKFEWEPVILKVTVPYLFIEGDGVVGGGDIVIPGTNIFDGVNSGLGDVMLSATYVYYPNVGWLPVTELTGKVKFPTADEDKGIGTGEFDYTLQLDLSKTFGRFTPFGTVGYRFMGDPPGVKLRNFAFVSGGLGFRVFDRMSIGAIYDWRDNSSPTANDTHELVSYASLKMGSRYSLNPYAVVGLSKFAPDWGLGFQIGVTFGRR